MEIWKDINNYEGLYQVSNLGKVRSLDREILNKKGHVQYFKGTLLKISDNGAGYKKVVLSKSKKQKQCYIHRLVAQAFIPNPENKPQVNHKDSDKENNTVDNLEWCTQKENTAHGQKYGSINKQEMRVTNKLSEYDIIEIARRKHSGQTIGSISREMGLPRTTVSSVNNGRSNKELFEFVLEILNE